MKKSEAEKYLNDVKKQNYTKEQLEEKLARCRVDVRNMQRRYEKEQWVCQESTRAFEEVNENLEKLLGKAGYRLHRYEVKFEESWCDVLNAGDDCEWYGCLECASHHKDTVIKTMRLYDYDISRDGFEAIDSHFKTISEKLIRLYDMTDGRIIYERQGEDEDEE